MAGPLLSSQQIRLCLPELLQQEQSRAPRLSSAQIKAPQAGSVRAGAEPSLELVWELRAPGSGAAQRAAGQGHGSPSPDGTRREEGQRDTDTRVLHRAPAHPAQAQHKHRRSERGVSWDLARAKAD